MNKILITRNLDKSKELKKYLEESKYQIFCEPLFEIKKVKPKTINHNFGAIIITSSNAVESFLELNFDKKIKIFCVGKKTAKKLSDCGFYNINISTKQNAISLKEKIIIEYKNKNLPILYLCGEIITLNFKKELKKFDILVENKLCYKTFAKDFSIEFLKIIKQSHFDYVLVFSQNSAKIFVNLLKKNNLFSFFQNSKIFGFSNKICDILLAENFKQVAKFDELEVLKKYYQL